MSLAQVRPEAESAVRSTVWKKTLSLASDRTVTEGSSDALREAIGRGADLRIRTDFRHNDHIDTASDSPEMVLETSEFRVTYLVDNRWAAGLMSLRHPIRGLEGFGPRPSMSYFLYNEDGQQAIARPHLDGGLAAGTPGPSPAQSPAHMPRYHTIDAWDAGTNAPSENFIYDFERYDFFVKDDWTEVLHSDEAGRAVSGSVKNLADAFAEGCDVKVGISGLCRDLSPDPEATLDHEVFVMTGSNYYYSEQKIFFSGTHPLIRVAPAVPLVYRSRGWDFGWVMARSDGRVFLKICDPYTLQFREQEARLAVRWFVR